MIEKIGMITMLVGTFLFLNGGLVWFVGCIFRI